MKENCCAHVLDYINYYVDDSADPGKWKIYLQKYLSHIGSIRILYSVYRPFSLTDKIFKSIDVTQFYINSEFNNKRNDLVKDYEVMIRHSEPTYDADGEVEKKEELIGIKEFALSISKKNEKRVSFGFVYCVCESKKHIFYSVLPDGSITSEEVDMSDSCSNDSNFLGKVLYMHNCLVEKDNEKGATKKKELSKPGDHA